MLKVFAFACSVKPEGREPLARCQPALRFLQLWPQHCALRLAMQAGVADHVWTIRGIYGLVPTPVAVKRTEPTSNVPSRKEKMNSSAIWPIYTRDINFMGYGGVGRWSDRQVERHIRAVAKDTLHVTFTRHATARLREKKITTSMVYECLRQGSLARTPEPNAARGTLECRMDRYTCGRNIGIVVAVCDEDPNLIFVTAIDLD